MSNKLIETSKGKYPLSIPGSNKDYEINKINDCAIGYFVLLEDNTRDYFTSIDDVLIIRKAYKN